MGGVVARITHRPAAVVAEGGTGDIVGVGTDTRTAHR
jgi:hypothetical protein